MMLPLTGRTAVVTGAAGGIGRAIALRLVAEGAAVAVADLDRAALASVADELRTAGAPAVVEIVGDLSDEAVATAVIDAAENLADGLDILVNNAGGGVIRPFLEHTAQTLRATIDRNLWTTIWCTRAALPAMIRRRHGRIINIGADSVHTGTYSHAGYNAAKGGVNGLTTGLAFEFGPHGITVNTISPGGVMTPMLRRLMDADVATRDAYRLAVHPRQIMATIPIGRFAEMEEVAALVAFLSGPGAGAINGQIVSVNGGQWMM